MKKYTIDGIRESGDMSVRGWNTLKNVLGNEFSREDVKAAVFDGRLMSQKNMGKKTYAEVCRYFEIEKPLKFIRHLSKGSDVSQEEALESAKYWNESREQYYKSCLIAWGYTVRKKKPK